MKQNLVKRARLKFTPKAVDLRRQAQVVEAMLADGEKLLDRAVLLNHLKTFGISGQTSLWAGLNHFSDWQNKSRMGPAQIPTELVDYLLYAGRLEPESIADERSPPTGASGHPFAPAGCRVTAPSPALRAAG